MNILGIESSCDETAAAVVKDGTEILSSVVASSHDMHTQFGGILPELASREQLAYMLPVVQKAIQQAFPDEKEFKTSIDKNIDAFAVTIGPGLIGSLLIGVETAKTLSLITGKLIIPVNHVLAHPYANFIRSDLVQGPTVPAIALVASGGHTELFLMNSEREMQWLGGTIDDAAGEAFDKAARLLGFGNDGGPAIASAASTYTLHPSTQKLHLPRPLLHDNTLNFSFSGLKTAIQRTWDKENKHTQEITAMFAYEVQEAITDVLVSKTIKAAIQNNAVSILLGGGVSANLRLREKFLQSTQKNSCSLFFPSFDLCTDNAVVIASCAYYHQSPHNYREISASPSLSVELAP